MVYSVSVDFELNKISCSKMKEKDIIADYVVRVNSDQTWFCIYVEAEDERTAIALAEIYIRKYIMDSAKRKYQKVFSLTMEYLKEWKI